MLPRRGKKRKLNRDDDPAGDEAELFKPLETLAYMVNADRASRERIQPHFTSGELGLTFSTRQLGKFRLQAKINLRSWKNGNMPYGAAKYFFNEVVPMTEIRPESDKPDIPTIFDKLGLNDIIKSTLDMHSVLCPNSCRPVNHRVTNDASVRSDETITLSGPSSEGQIQSDPPIIEFCAAEGILPDDIGCLLSHSDSGNVQQLTDSQLDALSGRSTATGEGPVYTTRRLSAHWAARWGISQAAMTDYCHLFKGHHPETFNGLPLTGKTLMKTPPMDDLKTFRPIHGSTLDPNTGEKIVVGEYMHLGIENGILGKSIGVVHWYEHATSLRRVHLVNPNLLPKELVEAVKPRDDDEFEDSVRENWCFDDIGEREPVVIELHVNIDGVQWYNNSSVKGTPILGRIHAIRNSKTCLKIPKGKPFIIGIWKQTGKCDVQSFVADFIAELKHLEAPTEDRPYSVKLVAMICDAPARCELKGVLSVSKYLFPRI